MLKGLNDRLEEEMWHLNPSMRVRVISNEDLKIGAWIGGSIKASLATFPDEVITREKYEDNGASIIHHEFLKI